MSLTDIHPMLVHFPIVLVLLAFLFDAVRVISPQMGASVARGRGPDMGTTLMTLAGLAAIVTYIFGDMAYDVAMAHGGPSQALETHEGWGTTTTIVLVVLAILRLAMWLRGLDHGRAGRLVGLGCATIGSVMVVVTAYFGGHLVYDLGVNVM